MGNLLSEIYHLFVFLCSLYPPKPTFDPEQIPDLAGQVIIVTGKDEACLQPVEAHQDHRWKWRNRKGDVQGLEMYA